MAEIDYSIELPAALDAKYIAIEENLLNLIGEKDSIPSAKVIELYNRKFGKVDPYEVRWTLWRLLDSGTIVLTLNRTLQKA
jgi:hypothetical protein